MAMVDVLRTASIAVVVTAKWCVCRSFIENTLHSQASLLRHHFMRCLKYWRNNTARGNPIQIAIIIRSATLRTYGLTRRLRRGFGAHSVCSRADFLLMPDARRHTGRRAASAESASSSTWTVTCSMPCRSFTRRRTARMRSGPAATSSMTTWPLIASKPEVSVQA